ncbi:MAG: AraC family transcriptional regulator [Bacteroidales bacterium]|nr:AraC family transcriptional regulator [Bacteroidales bacterium]
MKPTGEIQSFDLKALKRQLQEIDTNSEKIAADENDYAVFEDINQIGQIHSRQHYRINMAVFGLCLEGSYEISIDSRTFLCRRNSYITLFPNQVVKVVLSPGEDPRDTVKAERSGRGIFICINNSTYEHLIRQMHHLLPLFLYIREHPCAQLSEKDTEWISDYYRQLFREVKDSSNLFRRETGQSIMMALFYKVCNIYGHTLLERPEYRNRGEEIFGEFLRQLSLHYKEHGDVAFYARLLCLTPKYLSTTVKRISGKTAGEWIQSQVIEEAKTLLKTSRLSVKEIAAELGFPSQSFFGKYFRQHTGMTPKTYRNSLL